MSQKIPTRDQSPSPVQVFEPEAPDMYAKRKKIHPRKIEGFFQNIRIASMSLVVAAFVLLPWLNWDHRQALLFDLPERQFYIFGWTFLPQDFFFLSWMLIIAAFTLFVVTVFAGRVFCGYVCPQTTWTKIFMFIERITEGERNARIKLDKADVSVNKVWRRVAKHAGWLGVAFLTGFTFVGYFTPIRHLLPDFVHGDLGGWGYVFIGIFTVFTYMNAGWLREQVCFYMCPYGRFQSVMFDRDTLIISYDAERGDPRGSRKKDTDYKSEGLGDCIDCDLCVQVCPTGIDIRDGLQMECIQCAACVDACDSVMDKMGYSRGLVRYTTENMLEHKGGYHWMRPRLIGYATFATLMIVIFLYALATRVPLLVDVIRDRGQLYSEGGEGEIENAYTLKIVNKSQQTREFRISLESDNKAIKLDDVKDVKVAAGEIMAVPVTVEANPDELDKTNYKVKFQVSALDDASVTTHTESRFLAPPR